MPTNEITPPQICQECYKQPAIVKIAITDRHMCADCANHLLACIMATSERRGRDLAEQRKWYEARLKEIRDNSKWYEDAYAELVMNTQKVKEYYVDSDDSR